MAGRTAVLVLLALVLGFWLQDRTGNFVRMHESPLTTRDTMYRDIGLWLREQGETAAGVAYLEVGRIGYYSDLQVVDLLGLVTPGVVPQLRWHNFDWPVQRYKPRYYLEYECFAALLAHLDDQSWFRTAYEPVTTFEGPKCRAKERSTLTVYRLLPDAQIPDPLEPVLAQTAADTPIVFAEGEPTTWPGQTFTSPANNLAGIALYFTQLDAPTRGTVIFHLRAAPGDGEDIRRVEVPASTFRWNTWETLRFEPISDSAGKSYFLTIETRGIPAGANELSAGAISADLLPGGSRYEGEQAAAGDFALRVYVSGP